MLGKPKTTMLDERLDQTTGELLRAVKVSEDEIVAAASSSDLYDGVRLRIAEVGAHTGRRTSMYERLSGSFVLVVQRPRFLALAAAATILLLLAASAFVLLPGRSTEQLAQQPTETRAQTAQPEVAIQGEHPDEPSAIQLSTPGKSRRTSHRRQRVGSRSTEVATDFLPLTFVDDSRAQESGHVVRVKVLRSALVAFGVPMNMERAGELITADVVIGNDGLARAIRFVQ
jgi:hypothetical protein